MGLAMSLPDVIKLQAEEMLPSDYGYDCPNYTVWNLLIQQSCSRVNKVACQLIMHAGAGKLAGLATEEQSRMSSLICFWELT